MAHRVECILKDRCMSHIIINEYLQFELRRLNVLFGLNGIQ